MEIKGVKMRITKRTKLALINAGIAGGLVFFGSFSDGVVSYQGIIAAISASVIIFLTKIKSYFSKKGLKGGMFEFV